MNQALENEATQVVEQEEKDGDQDLLATAEQLAFCDLKDLIAHLQGVEDQAINNFRK